MDLELVDKIVKAVLYEGYMLYPYRPSAMKNRQRWNFGTLVPPSYAPVQGDVDSMQTECLVLGNRGTQLEVRVRFLQLRVRQVSELICSAAGATGARGFRKVDSLTIGDRGFYTVQDAVEREIRLPPLRIRELSSSPQKRTFAFAGCSDSELLREKGGRVVGKITLLQQPVEAALEAAAESMGEGLFRISVRSRNLTRFQAAPGRDCRDEALLQSMASTHAVLSLRHGQFISMMDPPARYAEAAAKCTNRSSWPVLVGREGDRDCMLASPIILYDYPKIAPESAGDLFDSTEIDELLTLRILTMTGREKREMRDADERSRGILERTESMSSEQMLRLHGAVRRRGPAEGEHPTEVAATGLKPGARVRLRPGKGRDAFDIILAGRTAIIESIEQDYDGRTHVAVTLDDDPGRDLGALKQPGHRFFFFPDEVELLED